MTNHGTAPTLGQFAEISAGVTRVLPKALTEINPKTLIARLNTDGEGLAAALNDMLREYLGEAQEQYPITVPYGGGETIANLLAAGKYDWTNNDITDEHFPQEGSGDKSVVIELKHYGVALSSKDATARLKEDGLRPANAAEILAFGAAYPDVQREFPVISLGQTWRYPVGRRIVVYLGRSGAGRYARLRWFGDGWNGLCRFAGVRE